MSAFYFCINGTCNCFHHCFETVSNGLLKELLAKWKIWGFKKVCTLL